MYSRAPKIVVGIDGSTCAINAALWAANEAVSRDIPLRLIYVVEPRTAGRFDVQQAARDLATADIAIRRARVAVQSAESPVEIEWEVVHGDPTVVLLDASRWADMVCVGSRGMAHATADELLGSTTKSVLTTASSPVAVVGPSNDITVTGPQTSPILSAR